MNKNMAIRGIIRQAQFIKIIKIATKKIKITVIDIELKKIFNSLDIHKTGYINSKQFQQLCQNQFCEPFNIQNFRNRLVQSCQNLFRQYDENQDNRYSEQEVKKIFYNVLELQQSSIQFIMKVFSKQLTEDIQFQQLLQIVFEIQFIDMVINTLKMKHQINYESMQKINCSISEGQFISFIRQNCFFMGDQSFNTHELKAIYSIITQNRSSLSIKQYQNFIMSHLCKRSDSSRKKNHQQSLNELQSNIVEELNEDSQIKINKQEKYKDNLNSKNLFSSDSENDLQVDSANEISQNKSLNDKNPIRFEDKIWQGISLIIKQQTGLRPKGFTQNQFKKISHKVLKCLDPNIIEGFFYLEKNQQGRMNFYCMISYILHYLGEKKFIKFTKKQKCGQYTFSQEELCSLLKYSFGSLCTFEQNQWQKVTKDIYESWKQKNQFTYKSYLTWITKALICRFCYLQTSCNK